MADNEYKYSIQKSDEFYHLYRAVRGVWDWELICSSPFYDTCLDYYNWIPDFCQGELIDIETFGMGVYG